MTHSAFNQRVASAARNQAFHSRPAGPQGGGRQSWRGATFPRLFPPRRWHRRAASACHRRMPPMAARQRRGRPPGEG
eukprot:scaffold20283_cov57-Phaeocystis_antarctica.AAC.3